MNDDIFVLKTNLNRNKLALYGIISLLVVLTFGLLSLSDQINQSAMTFKSEASLSNPSSDSAYEGLGNETIDNSINNNEQIPLDTRSNGEPKPTQCPKTYKCV